MQKHLFAGGPLSEEGAAAIYEKLAEEIYLAIVCESARWGDYRQSTGESDVTYTRDDFWLPRKEALMKDFFPYRTQILLQQLKEAELYPKQVQAPVFSEDSGTYMDSISVNISGKGQIYFTTDGKDPRVAYSAKVYSGASLFSEDLNLKESSLIKARCLLDGEWSALVERSYTIEKSPVVDALPSLQGMAIISIEIFDLQGRILARMPERNIENWQEIPSLALPEGVYIYRLRCNGEIFEGKFRKE